MIPDRNRDLIQAAAYRKLLAIARNHNTVTGSHVAQLLTETEEQLARSAFDVQAVMELLFRTRSTRLPNTQFVYWSPNQGHPRIRKADGREFLLGERYFAETFKLDQKLLTRLEVREDDLFQTSDQMIVYWWSSQHAGPWQVLQSEELDSLTFRLHYCQAHIYDGEVHEEPRDHLKPKAINLDTHHPDGTERSTNIRFPRRLNV